MSHGLTIASSGLAVLAAAALIVRRRREQSAGRAVARRHGWDLYARPQRDLLERLDGATLMQIGHSRRITEAFVTRRCTYLFPYVFETGFEPRRESHRWRVVAREVEHDRSRATVTRRNWLITAASGPASHTLPIHLLQHPARADGEHVAIVEDFDQWQEALRAGLADWFAQQPSDRTWEILPGWVVGYEPGHSQPDALAALAAASEELVVRLRG